jgi:hypothetical protein
MTFITISISSTDHGNRIDACLLDDEFGLAPNRSIQAAVDKYLETHLYTHSWIEIDTQVIKSRFRKFSMDR